MQQQLALVVQPLQPVLVDAAHQPPQPEIHEPLPVAPRVLDLAGLMLGIGRGDLEAREPGALHDVAQPHADAGPTAATARRDPGVQELAALQQAVQHVHGLAARYQAAPRRVKNQGSFEEQFFL